MDVKNRLKTNWSEPAESRFLRVPIFADQCQDVRGSYVFRVRVKYVSSHWEAFHHTERLGFWTFHRAPSFLTFIADFTTRVGIFHQLAGFYLYTPIWEKAPRKHFEKQHVRWLDICHVQSESVIFQKTAADRETTWILCPCCHQLVILSSVATSLPLYCHCAVRVDVSIPDIKPCPSRRLNQPETAMHGRCFKFCCSVLVSRLKRFSSRRPPSCLTCLPLSLTSSFAAWRAFISTVWFLSSLLQHRVTPLLLCSSSNFDPALCTLCFGSTAKFWPRSTLTTCRLFCYLTFETFDHTHLSLVPNSSQP